LALFALPAKHLPLFSVQSLGVSLLGALDGPRGALDGGGLRLSIRKTNADKETEAQQRDQSFHDFLRREVRVPAITCDFQWAKRCGAIRATTVLMLLLILRRRCS
jgi:hypothetical protein